MSLDQHHGALAVPQPLHAATAAGLLAAHKTVRLAVSGDVTLSRLEVALIDTPDFQRLRQVRQLGLAHLVYPTATHARFEHSLGTLAMAEQMLRAIAENVREDEPAVTPEQHALARLLALLHDVTHIPFGHTIEDEFRILPRHDEGDWRLRRFLGEESALGALLLASLGGELYGRLWGLLTAAPAPEDYFILDLVNNTVCADLLDYLQRDALFCNVAIETDLRFLRHLALAEHEGRRRMIVRLWKEGKSVPRRDVLNELIRLLDNRYLMSERVYYHHTKLVAGAMVAGAVGRAWRAGELDEAVLCELGDDVLLWRLGQSADPAARRLAQALAGRHLWKVVYERARGYFAAEQQVARELDVLGEVMGQFHHDAPGRMAQEDRLAELLGLAPGELLIHCPHHKMAMKLADILVFWNGALRPLKDCTDDELVGGKLRSILDSHQQLWSVRVCLAPEALPRAAAVADACEALFTFERARRARAEALFYRPLLEGLARAEGLGMDLSLEGWASWIENALARLLTLPDAERTPARARQCLQNE